MSRLPGVYLCLVHHPVKGRDGQTITTSVTNLDVHDLARTGRSYGLAGYYVVTPVTAQRELVEHILGHWRGGSGGERVPERAEALSLVKPVASLDAVLQELRSIEGADPLVVTTAARASRAPQSFETVRALVAARTRPVLLVFGTGHGLTEALLQAAEVHLAPVRPGGYNHLPVRAAVAIIVDRLFGDAGADPARLAYARPAVASSAEG
ncbi:MAG: RNA methyltransferase [Myxococcales bacterium]|nr:RNA methyltransferase [Myxococcales bacterium]